MAKKQKKNEIKQENSEANKYWLEKDKAERPMRRALGQAFRKAREVAGFSRNAMAKLAGIAAATLKKFEEGEFVERPRLVATSLKNALKNKQLQIVYETLTTHAPAVLELLKSTRKVPPRLV